MYRLIIILFLISCSSQKNEKSFEIAPSGNGYSNISKISSQEYYLETTCVGNDKRFQFLINDEDKKVINSRFYKKFNLELIELYRLKGAIGDFEVKVTQAGCTDESLNFDFAFKKDINNFRMLMVDLDLAFNDIPFREITDEIKKEFSSIVSLVKKQSKKYCKVDINFVAFKERHLCNVKRNGRYYQILWGKLDNGRDVINLSSSSTF